MIEYIKLIAINSWSLLVEMSPYLLLGFIIAGFLSIFISPEWVERHLGGNRLGSIVKASLFGVPLPLCSCGVIPVAAGLRRHGATKAATTSFLLSTPQTGVDSIAVTYSLMGPIFAIFRPFAAFITGIIGGSIISIVDPEDSTTNSEHRSEDQSCTDSCGSRENSNSSGKVIKALHYGLVTLPADIAKSLLIGLLLAGLITTFIPENWFAEKLGCGIGSMLAMMAFGIPFYICSTSSVPFAFALMAKGICPGAVLVFLITGPATNAATISVIWKILGKKCAVAYLATIAVCALASGLLLHEIIGADNIDIAKEMHHHVAATGGLKFWFGQAGAVTLLSVLFYSIYASKHVTHKHSDNNKMNEGEPKMQTVLNIEGMKCSHCSSTVQKTLLEAEGVTSADVSLDEKRAVVIGDGYSPEKLSATVRELGYECDVQ